MVSLKRDNIQNTCPSSEKIFNIGKYSANVQKAIMWLEGNKIAKGYNDGTFKPDDGCQRQHMAIFLYRYNNNIGK